ncbi:MAG: tetratricopeptide repeat protein [bacterium]|nr:tetratricopeptide repeat protein [bacterium]
MDDMKERIEELKKAAAEGDAGAQSQWGLLLATGDSVPQDVEEALSWLRRAAQQGEMTAMFNLGIILENGLGCESDLDEAALWYWQTAELGDTQAKMKLGKMLIKGQGFTPGSPTVQAIEASAEKGHPYAQSFYAKLHLDGVGVEPNNEMAEKWFRLSAAQGDESATFNLGEMMANGMTVLTPEEELSQWFFDLGMKYLQAEDLVKAFDCLVCIKRIDPESFLAQRLEDDIDRTNQSQQRPRD